MPSTTRAPTPRASCRAGRRSAAPSQQIVGLTIDHVVVIDLKGFSLLIDAMGGLDINVKNAGYGGQLPIGGHVTADQRIVGVKAWFTPGRQHLDGCTRSGTPARVPPTATRSARPASAASSRRSSSRSTRPRWSGVPQLARIARDNIYTDIPARSLPAFVDLVERVQKAKINSVPLAQNPNFYSGRPNYALDPRLRPAGHPGPEGGAPDRYQDVDEHPDEDEDPVHVERRSYGPELTRRPADPQQSPRPKAGGFVTNDWVGVARCC